MQDLEERTNSRKLAEAKLEIDVKLEVKTEHMECFSSDEETSLGRRIDASSVYLDACEDDLNATAGISLNQSDDDLNLSDFDLDQSSQNSPNGIFSNKSTMPTEEFCP